MKASSRFTMTFLAASFACFAPIITQTVSAQTTSTQTSQAPVFSSQELDAILAPIALYPDSLLSQVLMAATYPLEIVQAARWSKSSGNQGGDAALAKVSDQNWDPSVQSLVAFPQVLAMMSDQLDWTQKLGDAFLAQQSDVMDSIQRLRSQAQRAGNLSSNTQQNVVTQGQTIVIQPAQPSVIYVPAYNPSVVYGAWPYPAYPPMYYPGVALWYPGQAFVNGLAWGVGVAATAAIFGGFNWNTRNVNINVNNFNRINRNNIYSGNNNTWRHNPEHRGSVAYRDNTSRERFAANNRSAPAATAARNADFRGHAPQAVNRQPDVANRAVQRDAAPQINRPATAAPKRDAFQGLDAGRQQIDRGRVSQAAANHSGAQRPNRPNGGVGAAGGGHRAGGGGRGGR
jgi:hypothetical protein